MEEPAELTKDELGRKVASIIKYRSQYNWNITDMIYNLSGYFKFIFHWWINKKNKLNVRNRFKYYSKGKAKYWDEFDAIKFSKSMRNLRSLVASLLDDSEQFMIKHQKSNVLQLDASENNQDIDSNEEKALHLFSSKEEKTLHKNKIESFMVPHTLTFRKPTYPKNGKNEITALLVESSKKAISKVPSQILTLDSSIQNIIHPPPSKIPHLLISPRISPKISPKSDHNTPVNKIHPVSPKMMKKE